MKKHRLMVLGVSLLASLGVLSSGFAGWVIAADPISKAGTGAISADYSVVTNGVKAVTEKEDERDDKVRFAANAESKENGWLSATVKDGVADLVASFSYTVEIYEKSEAKKVSFTDLKFQEESGTGYDVAFKAGVVGSLPVFVANAPAASNNTKGYILLTTTQQDAGLTVNESNATASATIQNGTSLDVKFEIHFAWGTKFSGENPLDHFNGLPKNSANIADAQDYIAQLQSADGAKFKLSFTVGVTA